MKGEMMFVKYQHVESVGREEVEGLLDDPTQPVFVFPKIDGTNGSIWQEDGEIMLGSRNRVVTIENDNQGFAAKVFGGEQLEGLRRFFDVYPDARLFGEFLVKHTVKGYREDAWRKFYVFDVCSWSEESGLVYWPYNNYSSVLESHGIDYIPCIGTVVMPSLKRLERYAENDTFLLRAGEKGEGVVVKRYDFKNKWGRTVWGKFVRSEFKENHYKEMGPPEDTPKKIVEREIADKYVTQALVNKVHAKISGELGGFTGKSIPSLLDTVYYDLINEDAWAFLKEHKQPTIDFKMLNKIVTAKVKDLRPDLF